MRTERDYQGTEQGLTTRFDRTESDGLCAETPGPAEVYATCLFPISRSARILYMLPAGICGVRYNKKRRQRGAGFRIMIY